MDCTQLSLGLFSIFVGATALLESDCAGTTCSTTPSRGCDITCWERDLKTILPDGPMRNLPGTVRNLSLVMDNRNRHPTPTAVISWRVPTDAHVNVYEVYVYTWNHSADLRASTRHRPVYVVNTANTSYVDTVQVELRVTSSAFSGNITTTVFVSTWVGTGDNHSKDCYLRQAKVKFSTKGLVGSSRLPTKRWNYQASLSLLEEGGLTVGFSPLPKTKLHDIRVCVRNTHKSRNMDCQTQTVPRGHNTTTFTHSKTCVTYRIKIIPSPNLYREVYQVDRFVPALQCPACYQGKRMNVGITTLALRQRKNSEMTETLSVQSVVWSIIAALTGLAMGIFFVVLKTRKQRKLYHKQACDEDRYSDVTREQFWEELREAELKTIYLLYTEDSQCHRNVVDAFVRCLQLYCKCDITTLNLSHDIQHELRTDDSDIAILVDSTDLESTLNTTIDTRRNLVYCSLETSLNPISVPHCDYITFHELIKECFKGNVLIVRFPYTKQTSKHNDLGAVYDIPADVYDLVCCVHDFNIEKRNLSMKLCTDDIVTVDLKSAIREAYQWYSSSSCVTLPSDDVLDFSSPERDSVFDTVTSVSEELLSITREYERRRYNEERGDGSQITTFL